MHSSSLSKYCGDVFTAGDNTYEYLYLGAETDEVQQTTASYDSGIRDMRVASGDTQVSGNEEGTQKFPKFDTDLPIFLRFEYYLAIIDGGVKVPRQ